MAYGWPAARACSQSRAAARRQAADIGPRFRQRRASRGPEVWFIRKVRRNPPPLPRPARHAPGAETLAAAALAVHDVVFEGRSSDAALESAHERQDRAAVRAIALGTLRWYLRLKPALAPLVNRPFDELPPRLAALLVTTAHQVEYSRGALRGPGSPGRGRQPRARRRARQRRGECGPAQVRRAARRIAGGGGRPGTSVRASAMAGGCIESGVGRARPGRSWTRTTSIRPWCSSGPRDDFRRRFLRSLPRDRARRRLVDWNHDAVRAGSSRARAGTSGLRNRRGVGPGWRRATRRAAARCPARNARARCVRSAAERPCTSPSARPALAELIAVDYDPLRLARVRENLERAGRDESW